MSIHQYHLPPRLTFQDLRRITAIPAVTKSQHVFSDYVDQRVVQDLNNAIGEATRASKSVISDKPTMPIKERTDMPRRR